MTAVSLNLPEASEVVTGWQSSVTHEDVFFSLCLEVAQSSSVFIHWLTLAHTYLQRSWEMHLAELSCEKEKKIKEGADDYECGVWYWTGGKRESYGLGTPQRKRTKPHRSVLL